MRIQIGSFCGWGNLGDEGILQATMDELGHDNEYVVSTTLPFQFLQNYLHKVPELTEARQIYDIRTDVDAYLLGGGRLNWGYGWRQAIAMFTAEKPSMNYGVSYGSPPMLYHPKLNRVYAEFLNQFDAVTVRDEESYNLLKKIGATPILTSCPAINLKEEKTDCPEGMIAVCPRYEDSDQIGNPGNNTPQIEWIVNRLKGKEDEVLLIPFAPKDMEGKPVDLAVCREISAKLKNAPILPTDGFNPRQVKYAISKCKFLITGGRYHAALWAIAHGIPYEAAPTQSYRRIMVLINMHRKYGREELMKMEKKNVELFKKIMEGANN